MNAFVCALLIWFECVNDAYDFNLPVVKVLTIDTHLVHFVMSVCVRINASVWVFVADLV